MPTVPFRGGERGYASWYGNEHHGRQTASGEIFDQEAMTAAHRDLPFGTVVRVHHRETNRSVTVRVNDRGPFVRGRIIDLSRGAARDLGMIQEGVAPVRVEVLQRGEAPPRQRRRIWNIFLPWRWFR